jgi:hypothetical protein
MRWRGQSGRTKEYKASVRIETSDDALNLSNVHREFGRQVSGATFEQLTTNIRQKKCFISCNVCRTASQPESRVKSRSEKPKLSRESR